jgi:hypothetical protein
MQAIPYDLRAFGVAPVCVDTPEGRDEYQQRQRALSERAQELRARLIQALRDLTAHPAGGAGATPAP